MSLNILLDHNEASIVRENAASLVANLISHTTINQDNNSVSLVASIRPFCSKSLLSILQLLENYQFYKHLDTILHCFYSTHLDEANQNNWTTTPSGKILYSFNFLSSTSKNSTFIGY